MGDGREAKERRLVERKVDRESRDGMRTVGSRNNRWGRREIVIGD